jgi:RimJ/RimL family protein N-acetyltransferase
MRLLSDPTVNNQTIIVGATIVGSIAKFVMEGDAEITYWIDRDFWGQGIATAALKNFLRIETTRPLFGRVAFDNFGSQRVLEKCGFTRIGSDRGFANARQMEIEEFIYRLDV